MEKQNLENQELISLLDVYLSEFVQRNNLMWSQIFKFFMQPSCLCFCLI